MNTSRRSPITKLTPEARFWPKVNKTDGCWLWTAAVHTTGYGDFNSGSQRVYAHRFVYELTVGPIPQGLTIDHLCRVKLCVNPAHLEVVTIHENIRRAGNPRAQQTHCKWGHKLPQRRMGHRHRERVCRECANRRTREWYAKTQVTA